MKPRKFCLINGNWIVQVFTKDKQYIAEVVQDIEWALYAELAKKEATV
jgi:hypothetical protein